MTSPENAPWRPCGLVAGRHHVGMSGKGDVRRLSRRCGRRDCRYRRCRARRRSRGAPRSRRLSAGVSSTPSAPASAGVTEGQRTRSRAMETSIIHASRLTRQTGGGPALCGTISISLCWSQRRPRIARRCGASGSGPNRLVLREPFRQIHFDEAPQARERTTARPSGRSAVGIGKPVRELVVEAGHDEERHHPPAALVAVMQPLDRRSRSRPTGTATCRTA